MAEKVKLVKTVQQKEQFAKVVSRDFTTFVQPSSIESRSTVSELFRLYDELYLEIPLQGRQSHTYLIQESSKLVSVTQENDEIQPLLDEISELRERLLTANQQLIELQSQTNG